jgi:hypothetical protein
VRLPSVLEILPIEIPEEAAAEPTIEGLSPSSERATDGW